MTGFTSSTPTTSEHNAPRTGTWTARAALGLAGIALLGAATGGIWQVQRQQGHGQTVRSRPVAAVPVQQGQASVAVSVSSATNIEEVVRDRTIQQLCNFAATTCYTAEQLPSVSTTSGAAGVELVRDRTIQQLCNTEVTICYTAGQLTTAAATSSDDGASTDFDMHFTRP